MKKIILTICSLLLYGLGIFYCYGAREGASRSYLLLPESVDAARAKEIFTQEAALPEPVSFCFWGEKSHQMISCQKTGSYAEVTILSFSGNPGLLDAKELTWMEGCLLDEQTAYRLFGTKECNAQIIEYQDHQYSVLGTMLAKQPTLVLSAEHIPEARLDRCVLDIPAEQRTQIVSQFQIRWGLQGQSMDFYSLWLAVYHFLLFLPGILLMRIITVSAKKLRKNPGCWQRYGMILAISVIGLILLCRCIRIPEDMIPPKWSDFSFWGKWWEGQMENLHLILRTPLGERHLQMLIRMVKSIVSSSAALLLIIWTFRRQGNENTAD